jgi:tetratricopeptide (TPR) repeat protein
MIKNHKDPLQRIQLSLFVFVLGAILYYSMTMLVAVGQSPIQLATATTTSNTTSDEVTFLNNKGISLNSIGKFNESITYFDKVLAIDPSNTIALTQKANAFGGLGKYPEAITYYDKVLAIDPKNAEH